MSEVNYSKEPPRKKEKAEPPESLEYWWNEEDDERGKCMLHFCKKLEQDAIARIEACTRFTRCIEAADISSLNPDAYAKAVAANAGFAINGPTFNITARGIETLTAKVTKNRPAPEFVAKGGTWKNRVQAKQLNRWSSGLIHETDLYRKGREVFIDACVTGTGCLQLFQNDDGRLEAERVFESEMFVDDFDGYNGAPQCLVRKKYVQPEVLAALFPDSAKEIAEARMVSGITEATKLIEVWEAWHLPSKKGAKDGMHCIAIEGCELFHEKWVVQTFPFVFLRFSKRRKGFWGRGGVEKVFSTQLALNRISKAIDEQIRRRGHGTLFYQKGSLNPDHITNGIAGLIPYVGAIPVRDNQNSVAQEELLREQRYMQEILSELGVSELSVSARKPAGLESKPALLTYNDIESERFAPQHQDWESFVLDFVETAIELIKNQWSCPGYKIKAKNGRYLIELDLKDIDLDRDSYHLQCFPISSLSSIPAGRREEVMQLLNDGMIDKPTARKLLDMPDIETEMDLGNSAIDDVDATISAILDDAKPTFHPLEPYQDAGLMVQRATAAYLNAKNQNCDEERLAMLRELIDAATAIMSEVAPEAAPPMPPEMGMPMPMSPDMNISINPKIAPEMNQAMGAPPPLPVA